MCVYVCVKQMHCCVKRTRVRGYVCAWVCACVYVRMRVYISLSVCYLQLAALDLDVYMYYLQLAALVLCTARCARNACTGILVLTGSYYYYKPSHRKCRLRLQPLASVPGVSAVYKQLRTRMTDGGV